MGREINTLGSKANQADLQKLVVLMKDHLGANQGTGAQCVVVSIRRFIINHPYSLIAI